MAVTLPCDGALEFQGNGFAWTISFGFYIATGSNKLVETLMRNTIAPSYSEHHPSKLCSGEVCHDKMIPSVCPGGAHTRLVANVDDDTGNVVLAALIKRLVDQPFKDLAVKWTTQALPQTLQRELLVKPVRADEITIASFHLFNVRLQSQMLGNANGFGQDIRRWQSLGII